MFETATLKHLGEARHQAGRVLDVLLGNGNHDLHYLLAWESLAEREQKWGAFMADPAWISARSDSERDGPIVANINSMILQPTAFSAVK